MEMIGKSENEIKAREVSAEFPEDSKPLGNSLGYITVSLCSPGKEMKTHTHKRRPKAIRTEEITGSWESVD